MRAESSWSLLSLVSSLRAAVTAVGCSSISVSSFVIAAVVTSFAAAVVVIVCCSSISASSSVPATVVVVCCRTSISDSLCVAAVVVIVCHRSSISDSSCAAASCLPVNLFPSSSYLRSTSWRFSDESGSSRGSIDAGYLGYLKSSRMGGSLPKCIMSFAPASVQYLLFLLSITTLSSCFSFPLGDLKVYCFSGVFFECCIECHMVLDHQPLLHPYTSLVGLSRCVFSNVVSFRVYPRSELSVEVCRDDSDVFSVVAVSLDVFVHLLDVHVRVSHGGSAHWSFRS